MENREVAGSPPVKALLAARTGLRRFCTEEDPDKVLSRDLRSEAAELLAKLDEAAVQFGGRIRQDEEAAA